MFSPRINRLATPRALLARSKWTVLAVVLCCGGCATGDYAYVTRISSGEKIQIPLARGTPLRPKQGTIEIMYAGMRPNMVPQNKQMIYFFGFLEKSGKPPRSIRVEDVSDEKAVLMVEDLNPVLKDKIKWGMESKPIPAGDPLLQWVTYVDDAMRVFQFTIIDSEGKKIVLNQGWYVPAWAKPAVRHAIGMDPVK
jgi:hypothetical protein